MTGEQHMERRRLGRTGALVSEIGYGAWGIGGAQWMGAQDDESLRALNRAVDLGLNFIDTALAYGDGHSEELVGRLVRDRQEEILVATKIPPGNWEWPAVKPAAEVFPAAHIRHSCEKSLKNLGLERIDLLQLHVWRDDYLQADWVADTLRALQREGKVRWLGISINDHAPASALQAVASGLFDTVQVIFNIYDPTPAEALFPACQRHDVGVIVRVPFDEGGLLGTITAATTFPEGDFRNVYFKGERKREVHARTVALKGLLGEEAKTLPELALRFCLSEDAVSTVIPGMRRISSVEANVAASDGRRLSPALRERLRAHAWARNFYP
jgi:aryl-alcohol dehydrogenase-like predicted oxidoreductase